MTFPSFPKRSSSDDDALDHALNAWVIDERHSERSEESRPGSSIQQKSPAIDALEFHRWADETRRTDPAATGPAAGTWNRVLRSTAQAKSRGGDMSSVVLGTEPQSAIVYDSRPYNRRELGRYLNLAATFAIVFAVTIGGWFAMSQLPPGSDGRFAAIQETPEVAESQACDVEPLTVDEVVAIVENPYSVAPLDTWGTPSPSQEEGTSLAGEGHREMGSMVGMPETLSVVPSEEEFSDIQSVADHYLACIQNGTVGQRWALIHPETLQSEILSRFPVYRDQAEVRAVIEEAIDRPMRGPSDPQAVDVPPDYQTTFATPDRARVRVGDSRGESLLADQVAWVGLDMKDETGEVVGKTDWDATILEGDVQSNNGGYSLILVYSEITDTWYFYGTHAPRG